MQFSILTILSLAGLSAALALPVDSIIEKRCSSWNKVFNPCSCPSQQARCDLYKAIAGRSVDLPVRSTVDDRSVGTDRFLALVEDLSVAIDALPLANLTSDAIAEKRSESTIEKRCSSWNKVFNPCSCPSQQARCDLYKAIAGRSVDLPVVAGRSVEADQVLSLVEELSSVMEDLPLADIQTLSLGNLTADVDKRSDAIIDKRCSAWNKAFNPCICPSEQARCHAQNIGEA